MFRKFANGLRSAANTASQGVSNLVGTDSSSNDNDVQQLMAMGFDRSSCETALQVTNGNVSQAAEFLLQQQQQETTTSAASTGRNAHQNHHPGPTHQEQEDQDLARALAASLQTDTASNPPKARTAAMHKAAQAAEARFANGGSNPHKISTNQAALRENHPGVKVIPKLQDKTVEEQLLRCADRLKSSPAAVDTLYRAVTTIQQHPTEAKYRTIDTTLPSFQRTLGKAPGAMDFLKALQFYPSVRNAHVLQLDQVDPARLYLGVSALEQTKQTPEYINIKARNALTKELAILRAQVDTDTQEAIRRADHLSQCPSEPAEGRGAWMQIALADHETIRRRFDHDDTLKDVLHWLGSHASAIPDKLTVTREWMLVDVNRYPVTPIDCATASKQQYTLQYLGCFPSGRLELVPSTPEWKETGKGGSLKGSARGLAAAPKEAL